MLPTQMPNISKGIDGGYGYYPHMFQDAKHCNEVTLPCIGNSIANFCLGFVDGFYEGHNKIKQ